MIEQKRLCNLKIHITVFRASLANIIWKQNGHMPHQAVIGILVECLAFFQRRLSWSFQRYSQKQDGLLNHSIPPRAKQDFRLHAADQLLYCCSTLKMNRVVYLKQNRERNKTFEAITGSCHKCQKPQAPTPRAPIRNRQTRKVANAKGLNRNTNLT